MKRLKSVDIFRGLSIVWMIFTHCLNWWLIPEDIWLYKITVAIFDIMGAGAFIFISGVSTTIFYRNRLIKMESSKDYNKKMLRNEYMLRASFILIISLIYNAFPAIYTLNPLYIWIWFVLLTIAISLFIAWPLLKTPKWFRIFFGAVIWIANQYLLKFLLPYEGEFSYYGVIFFILYHPLDQNPILPFFPFFLFGTVVGEVISDIYLIEDLSERRVTLIKKFSLPLLTIGTILIIFGIFFEFPSFLQHRTFSWMIYSLGIQLNLLSILLSLEELVFYKVKKSYKFLFYYSCYSLNVYLFHNLLYFLFYQQLTVFNVWIYFAITFIIIGIILRFIYIKWGSNASLKNQLSKLASKITKKIEERKKN